MASEWSAVEPLFEEPDVESPSHLAHKLLAAKDGTPRLILAAVASGPKQFRDLQKATGKPDGQITRALSTLHEEGILVERLHARQAPAHKTHELGTKGILVLSMMQAFRDAEQEVAVAPTPSVAYLVTRPTPASGRAKPPALPTKAKRWGTGRADRKPKPHKAKAAPKHRHAPARA